MILQCGCSDDARNRILCDEHIWYSCHTVRTFGGLTYRAAARAIAARLAPEPSTRTRDAE